MIVNHKFRGTSVQPGPGPTPPAPVYGAMYYTSTDGNIVAPAKTGSTAFGYDLYSNSYNERGALMFSGGTPTKIVDGAFSGCTTLASITIPCTVAQISYHAFDGCVNLQNINYDCTMAQWNAITKAEGWNRNIPATYVQCSDGQVAIYEPEPQPTGYTTTLHYTSTDGKIVIPYGTGITTFGAELISNTYSGGIGTMTFNGDVTKIMNDAFNSRHNLRTIEIPNTVKTIGTNAFSGCENLRALNIPSGVTSISYAMARACTSLTAITVASGNKTYSAPNGKYLMHKSTKTLVQAAANCLNTGEATKIGDYAFSQMPMTSFTINEDITTIGAHAFDNCTQLSKVSYNGYDSIIYGSPSFDMVTVREHAFKNVPATKIQCYGGNYPINQFR